MILMMLDTLKMMKNAFYFILVPNLFLFIANKSKPYKILDYWSRDILNFNFSEKGRGLVSSPHSVYDFFFFFKWFSCYILFEIDLIFLIKPF